MGDNGEILLKWKDHPIHLVQRYKYYLEHQKYVDITLECGGHVFKAHRAVLAISSNLFENMLLNRYNISLVGVQYEALYSVMEFMYYGQSRIPLELLSPVLKLAKFLELKGLASITAESVNGGFTSITLDAKKGQPPTKRPLMIESGNIEIPPRIPFVLKNGEAYVSGGDQSDKGKTKTMKNLEEFVESLKENPILNSSNQSLRGQKCPSMRLYMGCNGERRIACLDNPSSNPEDIRMAEPNAIAPSEKSKHFNMIIPTSEKRSPNTFLYKL